MPKCRRALWLNWVTSRTSAFGHIISNGEALLNAAVGGMGIAYLATWLAAEPIDNAKLTVLPFSTPSADLPITALWPRSRDLASKVRVIVDA